MSAVLLWWCLLPGSGSAMLVAGPSPRNTGTPFLRAWSAEDYGGAPVNWMSLQDPATHFLYVANNFGLLEYDGAEWRLIELGDEGRARTLAIDAAGRIWVAGDDIVRLVPDRFGQLRAESQLGRLPPEMREVGSILFSAVTPRAVGFASTLSLYVFPNAEPAFRLEPAAEIRSLATVAGRLYLTLDDGHVLRLEGRELVPVAREFVAAGPEATGSRRILDARPVDDRQWVLLTNRARVWVDPATEKVERVQPLPADLFTDNQVAAGTLLGDGGFACATVRSGLLVYDAAGQVARRVDSGSGLVANRINAIREDAEGGLWLALRNGLARVQLDSPFARHGRAQGLEGGPRALLRFGGRLYVGHNEGLAVSRDDGTFEEVPGMQLGANRLMAQAGRLFVTSGATREIVGERTLHVVARQALGPLIPSRSNPQLLFGGAVNGVWIDALERDALRPVGRVSAVPGPISHLLDSGDGYLWAAAPTGGVWRIDFRAGIRADAPVRRFTEADGLGAVRRRDDITLFELGGEVIVSTAQWLRRYDRAADRFGPERRLEGIDAEKTGATDVSVDETGGLWLRLGPPGREIVRVLPVGPGLDRWRAEPLPSAPLASLVSNGLYADLAVRTVWLAGQGGLVSLDLDWKRTRFAVPLVAGVRRMLAPDGTPLLDPARSGAVLPADQRELRIDYAAPTFEPDYRGLTGTRYRTKLEGLETAWTDWSPTAYREFTHLPYRNFVFHVQARDLAGRTSGVASLAFGLTPPWWLTSWAYAGYGMALIAGLLGVVAVRTRTLQRRNEQLESAVAARTRELHGQNLELARLHRLELDEKVSARLAEEKARLEVLRYQLNPHFLFNVLNAICAHINRDPVAARAMVVRLAEFCRLTLYRPAEEQGAVTIGQELTLLGVYLDIERVRLGELMTVEIVADPEANRVRLPPFLLLPLVENAVKYGAATSASHLTVRLSVRPLGAGAVEIEVANTGRWVEPGTHSAPSHGIGLENLRQRLARYYPSAHELTTSAEDGWVIIRLRLLAPLHAAAHTDY